MKRRRRKALSASNTIAKKSDLGTFLGSVELAINEKGGMMCVLLLS